MRPITPLVITGLLFGMLAGCGEIEMREKTYPDGRKAVVNAAGEMVPSDQYFDPKEADIPDGINISERPVAVWAVSEIHEVTIQPGDTLVDIINPYFMNEHFRMNYEWYAQQVLELNNITDPHYIRAGDVIKIPIFIDKGTE